MSLQDVVVKRSAQGCEKYYYELKMHQCECFCSIGSTEHRVCSEVGLTDRQLLWKTWLCIFFSGHVW